MAFKQRRDDKELIRVKVIDEEDGSFELLRVTLEEFKTISSDFFQPKYFYKGGKGYPFPDNENEWDCLLGSFIILEA